jgi:hypothetical protein
MPTHRHSLSLRTLLAHVCFSPLSQMLACAQNFDTAKKKYEAAKAKADGKGESSDKYDAVKFASDEAEAELAKAQTGYSVALQSFLDQDRQLGAPLVDLVTEQMNFHRTSLLVLEQMMPKLQQTCVKSCSFACDGTG